VASSAVILVLFQGWMPAETALETEDLLFMFLIGTAAVAGYLAFYKGLALGPVAVVSPIAAGDGAVVALIGVLVLGEVLAVGHFLAMGLLVLGVVLAATDLRELKKGLAVPSKGPLYGLVTMFGFGIAIAGITYMAERCQSFLLPVLVLRACILIQIAFAAGVRREWYLPGAGLGVILAAILIGVLDTASLLALAQGMVVEQDARMSLLGPLYGTYPVVTLLLSLVFLREKVVANQWVGIVLVLLGTLLMVAI